MPSPTLLMIAPFFPPRRRVGAQRPYRLAKELPAQGWNAAVVALDSKGRLSEEERRGLAAVPVHRIHLPWDRTQSAMEQGGDVVPPDDRHGVAGGKPPEAAKRTTAGSERDSAPWLASWIDRMTPLDTWWPAMMLGLPGVKRFARSQVPAAIWSTGDPWSSHWLAFRLKASLDIPWIADFRDPWTLSAVPLRARSRIAALADRRFEQRVMRSADRIVFTCRAAADRYAEHYPGSADRIRVVHNSAADPSKAESPTLPAVDVAQRRGAVPSEAALEVLFAGRFRRLSPVDPVLDVLKVFRSAWENDPPLSGLEGRDGRRTGPPVRIHHIGGMDAADRARVETEGLADWFVEHPDIAQERLLEELSRFDLLLLSTHASRVDIIPAKLWDYLAVDRPILSLCPNPEVAGWLKEAAAGSQFEPGREAEAAAWLMDAIASFRRQGAMGAAAAMRRPEDLSQRISSGAMAAALAGILREVAR